MLTPTKKISVDRLSVGCVIDKLYKTKFRLDLKGHDFKIVGFETSSPALESVRMINYQPAGHIITGNLKIISDSRIR